MSCITHKGFLKKVSMKIHLFSYNMKVLFLQLESTNNIIQNIQNGKFQNKNLTKDSYSSLLIIKIRVVVLMKNLKPANLKPEIDYEIFEKVDIRVGTIELVEDIPKSDKLVRMTVNFGDHNQNIIAGLKQERKNPKEIEGIQALFVVNLKPRKMMGEVSEGMLFDIGYSDGITPVLAIPEKPVPNGVRGG